MLCKQCKNNQICKHFEYFKSINSNISLSINSCDYNNNPNAIQYTGFPTSKGSSTFSVDIDKPTYRQPIEYKELKIEEIEEFEDEEERIIVDLSSYADEVQSNSIIDIFMGENKDDNKEEK